jgi:hypothetical protein
MLVQYRDAKGTSWPAVVVRVVPVDEHPEWRPLDLRVMCDSSSLVKVTAVERCPDGDEEPNTWSLPA